MNDNETDLINIKMQPEVDIKDYINKLPGKPSDFLELVELVGEAQLSLENLQQSNLRSLLKDLPDCNIDTMLENLSLIESFLFKKWQSLLK